MNTINASTGFSPFQLRMGRSPRVIPPLICSEGNDLTDIRATAVIERLQLDVLEAKDNMLRAKISQSLAANEHRTDAFPFEKGSRVVLCTLHRCQDYKAKDEKRVAKFMPRFDGPYLVMETAPEISTVTIDLPNHPSTFPTFHTSQVRPFVENNKDFFPGRKLEEPPPVFVNDEEEFFVDRILDEQKRGRGLSVQKSGHMDLQLDWTGPKNRPV
jgi:hypothetical protein